MRKELKLERDVHLGEEGADGRNEWLVVELKCREKLPQWICEGLLQAQLRATSGELPILILHRKGARKSLDLVVMGRSDFEERFGQIANSGDAGTSEDVAP